MAKDLVLKPTEGLKNLISFGDDFKLAKIKEHLGEIVSTNNLGVNSDQAEIRSYEFTSGVGVLTANGKIVEIWLKSDKSNLDSGIKTGEQAKDIIDEYGNNFRVEGDPKYGEGIMIYNLYPNHILTFTVNEFGNCVCIMAADCGLIYKISPSSSILKNWDIYASLQKPSDILQKLTILKDSSEVDGKYMIIQGEIFNKTDKEVRYVNVIANIYDKNNQVIDVSKAYIDGLHLKPGETSTFIIVSTEGKLASKYNLQLSGEQ